MIMIVVVLRTKPSGLYRHRRGLGLHKVGYRERNLHIRISKLPSTQRRVTSRHGKKSSILYLHSPTVRLKYIVRLFEDPLIQDSLSGSTVSASPRWTRKPWRCGANASRRTSSMSASSTRKGGLRGIRGGWSEPPIARTSVGEKRTLNST